MSRLRYRFSVLRTRDFLRASGLMLAILLTLAGTGAVNSLHTPGVFSTGALAASPAAGLPNPTQSSPIAIAHNGQFVVNVNPDANTITVLIAFLRSIDATTPKFP
jgi:hypothetical protein